MRIVIAIFVIGWAGVAVENWDQARRGRISADDAWVGLRYGWAWPVAIIGALAWRAWDKWSARK